MTSANMDYAKLKTALQDVYSTGGRWLVLVFVGLVCMVYSYAARDLPLSIPFFIVGAVAVLSCVAAYAWSQAKLKRKDDFDQALIVYAKELTDAVESLQRVLSHQLEFSGGVMVGWLDFLRANPRLENELRGLKIEPSQAITLIADSGYTIRAAIAAIEKATAERDAIIVQAETKKLKETKDRLSGAITHRPVREQLAAAVSGGHTDDLARIVRINATEIGRDRTMLPIVEAVKKNDPVAVQVLLTAGANPDARDSGGRPLLVVAAHNKNDLIVDSLLHAKAAVNASDPNRRTALMIAADNADLKVARLLVAPRADINAMDDNGQSAMFRAKKRKHGDMIALLQAAGAKEEEA